MPMLQCVLRRVSRRQRVSARQQPMTAAATAVRKSCAVAIIPTDFSMRALCSAFCHTVTVFTRSTPNVVVVVVVVRHSKQKIYVRMRSSEHCGKILQYVASASEALTADCRASTQVFRAQPQSHTKRSPECVSALIRTRFTILRYFAQLGCGRAVTLTQTKIERAVGGRFRSAARYIHTHTHMERDNGNHTLAFAIFWRKCVKCVQCCNIKTRYTKLSSAAAHKHATMQMPDTCNNPACLY